MLTSFCLADDSSSNVKLTLYSKNAKSFGENYYYPIRVAHLGNSVQYFNDFPRLLEHLLKQKFHNVTQDSCLRGGATLTKLYRNGNGMQEKFQSPPAKRPDGTYDIGARSVHDLLSQHWDFVIMNDHTRGPAQDNVRKASKKALQSVYLPQLLDSKGNLSTTVIYLMSAAYRKPVRGSDEFGTYDEFTAKLEQGTNEYQTVVPGSVVAPVGLAYQYVHQHYPEKWEALYAFDDMHPSPQGTLLYAYIVFVIITGTAPPVEYSPEWWETARYMQHPTDEEMPLPTLEEVQFVRRIACQVCGLTKNGKCFEDGDEDTSVRL